MQSSKSSKTLQISWEKSQRKQEIFPMQENKMELVDTPLSLSLSIYLSMCLSSVCACVWASFVFCCIFLVDNNLTDEVGNQKYCKRVIIRIDLESWNFKLHFLHFLLVSCNQWNIFSHHQPQSSCRFLDFSYSISSSDFLDFWISHTASTLTSSGFCEFSGFLDFPHTTSIDLRSVLCLGCCSSSSHPHHMLASYIIRKITLFSFHQQ